MEASDLQDLYEEKYARLIGKSFEQWLADAPRSEEEAYARLEVLDRELKKTEIGYQEASGDAKWELGEYREKLRNEYQFLEELFGLGSPEIEN